MASPNSYEKPSPWNQRQSLCSLAQSRENLSAIATTAKRAVLKTGSVAELYVNSCLGSFDSKMSYWFKRLFLRVFWIILAVLWGGSFCTVYIIALWLLSELKSLKIPSTKQASSEQNGKKCETKLLWWLVWIWQNQKTSTQTCGTSVPLQLQPGCLDPWRPQIHWDAPTT